LRFIEEVEKKELNFISIENYRIDFATLKMIFFCCEFCEIDTLKLLYNNLDEDCVELLLEEVGKRSNNIYQICNLTI